MKRKHPRIARSPGRPRRYAKRTAVAIHLNPETLRRLDYSIFERHQKGDTAASRSEVIEKTLREKLKTE